MKTTEKIKDNIQQIKKQAIIRSFACLAVGLIGIEISNFAIQASTNIAALIFFVVCFVFGLKCFADAIFGLLQYHKISPSFSVVVVIANMLSLVFLTAPGANYLSTVFSLWYYPLLVIVIFGLLEGCYLWRFCRLYPKNISVDKISGVLPLAFSSMGLASCLAISLSPDFGVQFVNAILLLIAGPGAVITTLITIVCIVMTLSSKNKDAQIKALYQRLLVLLLVSIMAIGVLFLAELLVDF